MARPLILCAISSLAACSVVAAASEPVAPRAPEGPAAPPRLPIPVPPQPMVGPPAALVEAQPAWPLQAREIPFDPSSRLRPTLVPSLSGVVEVATGSVQTCVRLQDRAVLCWGNIPDGPRPTRATVTAGPTRVPEWPGARRLSLGESAICGLLDDQTTRCWSLSLGGMDDVAELRPGRRPCARRFDGSVLCWPQHRPSEAMPVPGLSNVVGLDSKFGHACAVTAEGALFCWGRGSSGQLGDGMMVDRELPVRVLGGRVVEVAVGGDHTCARATDGSVLCWGANGYGQLGDGTTRRRAHPVAVPGVADAVQVVSGAHHSCALSADGTVRCWGWNLTGQLGDGTTTHRPSPEEVAGLGVVAQIASYGSHTCALLVEGLVACWGANRQAQIGLGTAL